MAKSRISNRSRIRERIKLFDSNTSGRRRSILFAMAVAAGFLGTTATSAVLVSVQHIPTIILLTLLSAGAFVFAGFLFAGWFDWLTEDEEFLWQLFDD